MKKLVFKKWVVNVLAIVCFISILVMASDCGNIKAFIISHIAALAVLTICSLLLKKYGKAL